MPRLDIRVVVGASAAVGAAVVGALLGMAPPRGSATVLFTVAVICLTASMVLLTLRGRHGDARTSWFAAGGWVAVAAATLQLLTFPLVAPGGGLFGTGRTGSALLYLGWHVALAVGAVAGVINPRPRARTVAVTAGLAVVALCAIYPWPDELLLRADLRFTPLLIGCEVAVAAGTLLAATVWYRSTGRQPSAVRSWVTIALVLSAYDVALNAVAGERFSPMWWASLLTRALSYTVLLAGLLFATVDQLSATVQYAGDELERADAETGRARDLTGQLLAFAEGLSARLTADDVARFTTSAVLRLTGLTSVRISVHESDSDTLCILHVIGSEQLRATVGQRVAIDPRQPNGKAFLSGEPVFCESRAEVDEQFPAARAQWDPDVESLASLPLIAAGRPVGVFTVWHPRPHRFDREQRELLRGYCSQAGLALTRALELDHQRSMAEILQRSLLPDRLPDLASVALVARYVPAASGGSEVGGDWYDAFTIDNDRVLLAVGDVMGKGIEAAKTMGQVRAAVRTVARMTASPARVLDALDRLAEDFHEDLIVTVCLVLLDLRAATATVSGAGHLPPLFAAPGTPPVFVEADGVPLGVPSQPRRELELPLTVGTVIALYTDGIVEDRVTGVSDGLERLAAAAATLLERGLAAAADDLVDGRASQHDDATLLLARLDSLVTSAPSGVSSPTTA